MGLFTALNRPFSWILWVLLLKGGRKETSRGKTEGKEEKGRKAEWKGRKDGGPSPNSHSGYATDVKLNYAGLG